MNYVLPRRRVLYRYPCPNPGIVHALNRNHLPFQVDRWAGSDSIDTRRSFTAIVFCSHAATKTSLRFDGFSPSGASMDDILRVGVVDGILLRCPTS